jgi:hypothetical protein
MTSVPLAVHADAADRIEEILHRKFFNPDGQVLWSELNVTVEGCGIQLRLYKPNSCETGASFFAETDYIDLRSLVTDKEAVEFMDFTGTQFERLKGAASYQYLSLYNRGLGFAYDRSRQISDEEYENFPTDIDARLRAISGRFSTEIDPRSYSMSYENTEYCSGVEITGPLSTSNFRFYLDPSDMEEFATLIEELAQTCDAGLTN